MYKIPDIVSSTYKKCRQVIHEIDQLFRKIGGDKQDQVQWKAVQQCFLYRSYAYLRLLYEFIGEFMNKFEDITIERDYPWLVRFTENISRDAPSQYNVYHMWLPNIEINNIDYEMKIWRELMSILDLTIMNW